MQTFKTIFKTNWKVVSVFGNKQNWVIYSKTKSAAKTAQFNTHFHLQYGTQIRILR